jgi:hypothetical protein
MHGSRLLIRDRLLYMKDNIKSDHFVFIKDTGSVEIVSKMEM